MRSAWLLRDADDDRTYELASSTDTDGSDLTSRNSLD
jgi:hypothetical protein